MMNMQTRTPPSSPPDDGYGFSDRIQHQLDHAARQCAEHGGRMTPQRRDVLGLILKAPAPVGAYDLLEQLKTSGRKPAPPTIYRALDFLLEHGLIHRIERLSAFVPCTHLQHDHPHDHTQGGAEPCLHSAQFLICRKCGGVTEIADAPRVLDVLKNICGKKNFTMQSASVEVEGLCEDCTQAAPGPKGHAPTPN
ncbi:Fur family transcriptional regulator [Acetobacter sp. LMG 32666]|uniref:Fur family transcriptional regulator n=1 Tax=Acetobacter sp. LMG 32666 TaxID=2959295 RepID=UPI0038D1168C